MFVSAGGLNVLVDFLEDDYEDERDLVLIGVNGIWSVFELQVCIYSHLLSSRCLEPNAEGWAGINA